MKNLIKKIDKHNKSASFRIWQDFLHKEHIEMKKNHQGQLVEKMRDNQ